MIIIRRHINNIALNPFEYVTNADKEVINFKDKKEALEYLTIKVPDIKNNEEILNEEYGIFLHEIDKAQYAQLVEEIKSNMKKV